MHEIFVYMLLLSQITPSDWRTSITLYAINESFQEKETLGLVVTNLRSAFEMSRPLFSFLFFLYYFPPPPSTDIAWNTLV